VTAPDSPAASPLLRRLAGHPGAASACRGRERSLTYAELGAEAARIAAARAGGAGGLGGSPVAFLAEPGPTHLAALLGIRRAGGLAVPPSPLHTRPELRLLPALPRNAGGDVQKKQLLR
jgi:acyl-CoA synthetase (AMP-forming)/AMP-acid ligase II